MNFSNRSRTEFVLRKYESIVDGTGPATGRSLQKRAVLVKYVVLYALHTF